MNESIAHEKSFAFSIRIVSLCRHFRKQRCEQELIRQILRSGTSIGANLAEASFAVSKKDFFSKVHISLKECSETWYWLRLLQCDVLPDRPASLKAGNRTAIGINATADATTKTLSKQSV